MGGLTARTRLVTTSGAKQMEKDPLEMLVFLTHTPPSLQPCFCPATRCCREGSGQPRGQGGDRAEPRGKPGRFKGDVQTAEPKGPRGTGREKERTRKEVSFFCKCEIVEAWRAGGGSSPSLSKPHSCPLFLPLDAEGTKI